MPGFLCVDRGLALPVGATPIEDGINFAVFSRHATHAWLSWFGPGRETPFHEIALDPGANRTGHIWHSWISGLPRGVLYAWRMDMGPNPSPAVHRFNPDVLLLDPYAKVLAGGEQWGVASHRLCGLPADRFDWRGDQPLNTPLAELVIYGLHVRAYTRHPSSGVAAPGTYPGLVEKIPQLARVLELTELGRFCCPFTPICEAVCLRPDELTTIVLIALLRMPLASKVPRRHPSRHVMVDRLSDDHRLWQRRAVDTPREKDGRPCHNRGNQPDRRTAPWRQPSSNRCSGGGAPPRRRGGRRRPRLRGAIGAGGKAWTAPPHPPI